MFRRFSIAARLARSLVGGALLVTNFAGAQPSNAQTAEKPQRIVSMNLCTDQLLLMLAEPDRIQSLSMLSHDQRSVTPQLAETAQRYPVNHGLAEEVLALKPDLVLAGAFSSRAAVSLLKRLGLRVVEFQPESGIADIKQNVLAMGEAIGEQDRAKRLANDMDARLAELERDAPPVERQPVYAEIDVNYWIAGDGTLSASLANAAGVKLVGQQLGFSGSRKLPLETLMTLKPDLYSHATRFADPPSLSTDGLQHPALRQLEATSQLVRIPESFTLCGTPYSLDAADILARARRSLATRG